MSCLTSGLFAADRYQIRQAHASFLPRVMLCIGLFTHVRQRDTLQNVLNALVHFAQRLANGAAFRLVAFSPHRDAGSDEQRSINGPNDLVSRNSPWVAGQRIAT